MNNQNSLFGQALVVGYFDVSALAAARVASERAAVARAVWLRRWAENFPMRLRRLGNVEEIRVLRASQSRSTHHHGIIRAGLNAAGNTVRVIPHAEVEIVAPWQSHQAKAQTNDHKIWRSSWSLTRRWRLFAQHLPAHTGERRAVPGALIGVAATQNARSANH